MSQMMREAVLSTMPSAQTVAADDALIEIRRAARCCLRPDGLAGWDAFGGREGAERSKAGTRRKARRSPSRCCVPCPRAQAVSIFCLRLLHAGTLERKAESQWGTGHGGKPPGGLDRTRSCTGARTEGRCNRRWRYPLLIHHEARPPTSPARALSKLESQEDHEQYQGISGPRTWGLRTSDLGSTRTRLVRHSRRVVLVCEEVLLLASN